MPEHENQQSKHKALAAWRLLPAAVFAAAVFGTSAVAATAVTNIYGNWAVTCAEKGGASRCVMTQTLRRAGTKRAVASWTIMLDKKEQVINRIVLPTGLNVGAGLVIELRGTPLQVPYSACAFRECVAVVSMNTAVEQGLSAEKPLLVRIVVASGKRFVLSFDGMDFPVAYAEFKKQKIPASPAK